ncbi:MAG TPA: hypothetical protein PK765_06760 [bacterium]|nr:hypothetical protein [bacterium]
MGIGDHAPPPRAKKPITKKQLQAIQAGFLHSQEIIAIVEQKEAEERAREQARIDAAMDEEFPLT